MSDDFKRKLEAYERGELTHSELEEFERELEKLEKYQEFLEEKETSDSTLNEKRQQKILKKSKWKARVQTAFFAIGILLLFTLVSTILTGVYYSWGTPDRADELSNVIDHTLTVTDPYGYMEGTSTNSSAFFGMEATRDINKTIGSDRIKVGELKVNFFFSLMSYPEREYFGNVSEEIPAFTYPGVGNRGMSDWNNLERLPEGTVVSAFVSFTDLKETKEVFQLFENKDMDLIWLAVDTSIEGEKDKSDGIIFDPIGFPDSPIWHDDDMILDSREEEKGLFGSKIISEGHSSPDYNESDEEIFHKQFLKTLTFLKEHEKKANNFYFGKLDLTNKIQFLKDNGVKHYGVVITGPTKEVLKLQDESWIGVLEVDEVGFWNWESLTE